MTADVVPSDDEQKPFKVVFLRGTEIIAEWHVESQEEGEDQLLEAVKELGASDDDDEENNDDEDRERMKKTRMKKTTSLQSAAGGRPEQHG